MAVDEQQPETVVVDEEAWRAGLAAPVRALVDVFAKGGDRPSFSADGSWSIGGFADPRDVYGAFPDMRELARGSMAMVDYTGEDVEEDCSETLYVSDSARAVVRWTRDWAAGDWLAITVCATEESLRSALEKERGVLDESYEEVRDGGAWL